MDYLLLLIYIFSYIYEMLSLNGQGSVHWECVLQVLNKGSKTKETPSANTNIYNSAKRGHWEGGRHERR